MIDFSIAMPRFRRTTVKPRAASWHADFPIPDIRTIELKTANVRGAYGEIIAAEDDGLPIDVRESGTFVDTRLTIVLTNVPTDRDRAAFARLSQRLARFGPISLKPASA